MRRMLVFLLLALAAAPRLRAQGDAASLIAAGRAQLEQFNPDSATVLLDRALAPALGATPAQRVRAYVLYGIAALTGQKMSAARLAFTAALQLNPAERVDSLQFLEPENLLREFNAQREAVTAPAAHAAEPLTVEVGLPADTALTVEEGRVPVTVVPSRRALAVVTAGPAEAPAVVLWRDTLPAGRVGALSWNLRDAKGALVTPGRYTVRVRAVDSAGSVSPTAVRVLIVSRLSADTQPLPPPLASSAFAPERVQTGQRSVSSLLIGVGLGAAAALLPSVLGRTELNQGLAGDATAYVVAGSVTVAGLVGFLAGRRTVYVPENAQRNAQLRQSDAAARAAIVQANAAARQRALVRVRLEVGGS